MTALGCETCELEADFLVAATCQLNRTRTPHFDHHERPQHITQLAVVRVCLLVTVTWQYPFQPAAFWQLLADASFELQPLRVQSINPPTHLSTPQMATRVVPTFTAPMMTVVSSAASCPLPKLSNS